MAAYGDHIIRERRTCRCGSGRLYLLILTAGIISSSFAAPSKSRRSPNPPSPPSGGNYSAQSPKTIGPENCNVVLSYNSITGVVERLPIRQSFRLTIRTSWSDIAKNATLMRWFIRDTRDALALIFEVRGHSLFTVTILRVTRTKS